MHWAPRSQPEGAGGRIFVPPSGRTAAGSSANPPALATACQQSGEGLRSVALEAENGWSEALSKKTAQAASDSS